MNKGDKLYLLWADVDGSRESFNLFYLVPEIYATKEEAEERGAYLTKTFPRAEYGITEIEWGSEHLYEHLGGEP